MCLLAARALQVQQQMTVQAQDAVQQPPPAPPPPQTAKPYQPEVGQPGKDVVWVPTPPELVEKMAENPEQFNMAPRAEELSVLFSDVRGFTTISEALTPEDLSHYINEYLTTMSLVIRERHRGTLDKYIGDAVMAFWGAPVADREHAKNAVLAALGMQSEAKKLNDAEQSDDDGNSRLRDVLRVIDGRSFRLRDGVWWQADVAADAPRTKVAAFSKEYLELAASDRALAKAFALGRVVVRKGDVVYEVTE